MKKYLGIGDIIRDWHNLASPGRFYAQSRVSEGNIRTLELTLFTKHDVVEYIEENKRIVPEQLAGQGYTPWLIALYTTPHPSAKTVYSQ